MTRASSRLTPKLASLLFLGTACGPGVTVPSEPSDQAKAYARRVCAAGEACRCSTPSETQEHCEDWLAPRFDVLLDDPSLELDERCLEDVVDEYGTCASYADFADHARCTPFQGSIPLGRPCTSRPEAPAYVNECAEGTSCSITRGVCIDGTSTGGEAKNEGDACRADLPGSCGAFGLYCAPDSRCRRAGAEGEPCDSFMGCWQTDGPFLYCSGWWANGTGICRESSRLGETCEPREAVSCSAVGTAVASVWCDPTTSTCVEGPRPAACGPVWPPMGAGA